LANKKTELGTLTTQLEKEETDVSTKTKKLADDEELRDDTREQLKADEEYFADTKAAAFDKSQEWKIRTKMRDEELAGVQGAIKILSEGSETLNEAGETFLQTRAVTKHSERYQEAYAQLKTMAAKHQSSSLARLATMMKSAGHFDDVMAKIDSMVGILREEEQDDLKHRDRCETKGHAIEMDIADTNAAIEKSEDKLDRMENADHELETALGACEQKIEETEHDMQEMADLREEERAEFEHALNTDSDAVKLVAQAITKLSKYYKDNNLPVGLLQKTPETEGAPAPAEESVPEGAPAPADEPVSEKPPKTEFTNNGNHQGESRNIVAILGMMKEDFEKEMQEGRADDAKAQEEYEKQKGALQETLDAQKESKVNLEEQRASLNRDSLKEERSLSVHEGDLDAAHETEDALHMDCNWLTTHFDDRREKRKTEMDGLVDAKNFLAGMMAGDAVLPPSTD